MALYVSFATYEYILKTCHGLVHTNGYEISFGMEHFFIIHRLFVKRFYFHKGFWCSSQHKFKPNLFKYDVKMGVCSHNNLEL